MANLTLNKNKLVLTAIGALMVMAAVSVKNSMVQMGEPDSPWAKYAGPMLFVAGWAVVAYSAFGMKNYKNYMMWAGWGSVALIVAAVMLMMKAREDGAEMNMLYPAMFVAGWLAFAYLVGRRSNATTGLALGSAGLVFASMMYFLPKQREQCVVDGPGHSLFALAWVGIAFANALM